LLYNPATTVFGKHIIGIGAMIVAIQIGMRSWLPSKAIVVHLNFALRSLVSSAQRG
jgi:hypothetical protein